LLTARRLHTGEWRATSIAGNDITSSCLYVAGIATMAGGKFAPISLLIVAIVLYLFRGMCPASLVCAFWLTSPGVRWLTPHPHPHPHPHHHHRQNVIGVYTEVGSALPMNGGSYTCLLNTTTKLIGSVAACLTMLSYTATAVVSAQSAMSYFSYGKRPLLSLSLHRSSLQLTWYGANGAGLYDGFSVYWGTIIILGIFAALNLCGLSESANVALLIFVAHIFTLTLLCATAFAYMAQVQPAFLLSSALRVI
jgi:amino acid transporter